MDINNVYGCKMAQKGLETYSLKVNLYTQQIYGVVGNRTVISYLMLKIYFKDYSLMQSTQSYI